MPILELAAGLAICAYFVYDGRRTRAHEAEERRLEAKREDERATMPGYSINRALEANASRREALEEKLDDLRGEMFADMYYTSWKDAIASAEKELEALAQERIELLNRLERAQSITRDFNGNG